MPKEPMWKILQRIADRAAPKMQQAFLKAAASAQTKAKMTVLTDAIRQGDFAKAWQALDWERTVNAELTPELQQALLGIVKTAGIETMSDLIQGVPSFDLMEAPQSVYDYVNKTTGNLITNINRDTLLGVRDAVREAFLMGKGPPARQIFTVLENAANIKESLGLNARQMKALNKYRANLKQQGVSPQSYQKMTDRYKNTLLKQRASMIARTESINAACEGQRQIWEQAVNDGSLDAKRWDVEWLVTPDDITCKHCMTMRNKRRPIKGVYTAGFFAGKKGPAAHPNCRCSERLVPAKGVKLPMQGVPTMNAGVASEARVAAGSMEGTQMVYNEEEMAIRSAYEYETASQLGLETPAGGWQALDVSQFAGSPDSINLAFTKTKLALSKTRRDLRKIEKAIKANPTNYGLQTQRSEMTIQKQTLLKEFNQYKKQYPGVKLLNSAQVKTVSKQLISEEAAAKIAAAAPPGYGVKAQPVVAPEPPTPAVVAQVPNKPPVVPTPVPPGLHEPNKSFTWNKGEPAGEGHLLNGKPLQEEKYGFWKTEGDTDLAMEPIVPPVTKPGQKISSGAIIVEPDGRIWVVEPTNHYGGYNHSFPKGGWTDQNLTLQQNAMKEVWEESGLKIKINGYIGDFEGQTSNTRYYLAERTGGAPWAPGKESQAVKLMTLDDAESALNVQRDKDILKKVKQMLGKETEAEKMAAAATKLETEIQAQVKAANVIPAKRGPPVSPGSLPTFIQDVGKITPEQILKAKKALAGKAVTLKPFQQDVIKAGMSQAQAEKVVSLSRRGIRKLKKELAILDHAGMDITAGKIQLKEMQLFHQELLKQLKTYTVTGSVGILKAPMMNQTIKISSMKPIAATYTPTTTFAAPAPKVNLYTSPSSIAPGTKLEASKMVKVGEQKGSNPGGVYRDQEGKTWYIKQSSSEKVAQNEVVAAKLYELAGVATPQVELAEINGVTGVASRMVPNVVKSGADYLSKLVGTYEGFATDAWLANWDVVGLQYDNLLAKAGVAVRVDTGGSLLYRAQGGLKGSAFGNTVDEIDSLRNTVKNVQSAKVFGAMTKEQLAASMQKVVNIDRDLIEQTVMQYGPGTFAERSDLANKLLARHFDIAKKLQVLKQELQQQAAVNTGIIKPMMPYNVPAKRFSTKEAFFQSLPSSERTDLRNFIENFTSSAHSTREFQKYRSKVIAKWEQYYDKATAARMTAEYDRNIANYSKLVDQTQAFTGTTYRGISVDKAMVKQNYKPGQTIEWTQNTSTSTSQTKARGFGDTIFTIEQKNAGVSIEDMSHYRSEKEVMIRGGTKFRVTRVEQSGSELHVYLTEANPAEQVSYSFLVSKTGAKALEELKEVQVKMEHALLEAQMTGDVSGAASIKNQIASLKVQRRQITTMEKYAAASPVQKPTELALLPETVAGKAVVRPALTKSDWQDAPTLARAKEQTASMFPKMELNTEGMDTQVTNAVMKKMSAISKDIPELRQFVKGISNTWPPPPGVKPTAMCAAGPGGEIWVNPRVFNSVAGEKEIKIAAKNGWSVARNQQEAITHEVGHLVADMLSRDPSMRLALEEFMNTAPGRNKLSMYAVWDKKEAFAEGFTKMYQGGNGPYERALKRFLSKTTGRKFV